MLTPELVALLSSVDTPTICNALEIVAGKRAGDGFTRAPVVCVDPALPAIVGHARTAKIRGTEPSRESAGALRQRRIDYYRYASPRGAPTVVVIEDEDETPGIGSFWGEVNVAIHRGLGVAGALTNGSMRDLGTMEGGFQIVAGLVSPSHAHVHLTAIDCPVTVFGLPVGPDDVIHADRHGAALIPAAMLGDIARGVDVMTRREAVVLKAARSPGFTVDRLIAAWDEGDGIR